MECVYLYNRGLQILISSRLTLNTRIAYQEEGVDFDKRGMLYHHSSNPFEVSVHQVGSICRNIHKWLCQVADTRVALRLGFFCRYYNCIHHNIGEWDDLQNPPRNQIKLFVKFINTLRNFL